MISVRPINERRSDPRLENNVPVKICQEGGDLVAETLNISRSGAYCCVERYIAPMTKLKMHLLFSLPEKSKKSARKVSCEGVIVRCEQEEGQEGYNIAIFFSDINKRDSEFITDYVNSYMERAESEQ